MEGGVRDLSLLMRITNYTQIIIEKVKLYFLSIDSDKFTKVIREYNKTRI